MKLASLVLVTLIALLHFYIAWFEIFAWTTRGPQVFTAFPQDLFAQTTQMAANQGIYNAFLAAGLTWSLFIADAKWQRNVASCFLIFVAVAGIFGALTVTSRTLLIQTLPAAIGLITVFLSYKRNNESA